jgi:F-type H+-transporting ATPase subunit alpha
VLDDLPVQEVRRFEQELHEFVQTRYSGLLGEIRESGQLPDGDALGAAVNEFHDQFVAALAGSAPTEGTAA